MYNVYMLKLILLQSHIAKPDVTMEARKQHFENLQFIRNVKWIATFLSIYNKRDEITNNTRNALRNHISSNQFYYSKNLKCMRIKMFH